MKKILCALFVFFGAMNGMELSLPPSGEPLILRDLDGGLFEVRMSSLWRQAFSLPFSEEVSIPGSVSNYEIDVPVVADALQDIDFLLNHLDDEAALLRNLQLNSCRLINLLRNLCLLGIKKHHKLLQLVLCVHTGEITKEAFESLEDFKNFCEGIRERYPSVKQGVEAYVSLLYSSPALFAIDVRGLSSSAVREASHRAFESCLKSECGEGSPLDHRKNALCFVPHMSVDSVAPETAHTTPSTSGRVTPVDVDLSNFVALINRSDINTAEKEALCFNELIACDLSFLNAALSKVYETRSTCSDQFIHILMQAVAYKYRDGGGFDPDNPDAFITLFRLWDQKYSCIAASLKMYMYLFLPNSERLHLNSFLTDYLDVESFVRQNPEFKFLQGRCAEILETCPSLPHLFENGDLSKEIVQKEMYALVDNNYAPFWGALVDRGAKKHGFSWEHLFWTADIDMLRRMPLDRRDARSIDPNGFLGKGIINNGVKDPGMPVLTYLALRGNAKLVDEMLKKGANPFRSMESIWEVYQCQQHNESMKQICALLARKAYQIEPTHALSSPMFKDVDVIRELFSQGFDCFLLMPHFFELTGRIRTVVLQQAYATNVEQLFKTMRYGSERFRAKIFELLPQLRGPFRTWHVNKKMSEKVARAYSRRTSEIGRIEARALRRAERKRKLLHAGNPEKRYSVDDLSRYSSSLVSLDDLRRMPQDEIEDLRREARRDDPETWAEPRSFELSQFPQEESHEEMEQVETHEERQEDLVPCSHRSKKNKKGCCHCSIL